MTAQASILGALFAAALCLSAGGALADTTVGTPNDGNCYPFNCNDSGTSSGQSIDYEQIYASSAFSGITTFNKITFSAFASGNPALVIGGNYDIIFGTTTQPLGSTYPLSLSNTQTFFDGSLPAGSGTGNYSIGGSSYTYNPADGKLVMEVIVTNQANIPNGDNNGYFNTDDSGTVMSRTFDLTGTGVLSSPDGLVTTFSVAPEPAAWALLLTGMAGLGAALRSRRKAATA